jgi:hypothetical protein
MLRILPLGIGFLVDLYISGLGLEARATSKGQLVSVKSRFSFLSWMLINRCYCYLLDGVTRLPGLGS